MGGICSGSKQVQAFRVSRTFKVSQEISVSLNKEESDRMNSALVALKLLKGHFNFGGGGGKGGK